MLLLDDILDEGRTLATIRSTAAGTGRAEVLIAAFAVKDRAVPAQVQADFAGVSVPDRFVFGFGMDVAGAWRNLPSIRALPQAAHDVADQARTPCGSIQPIFQPAYSTMNSRIERPMRTDSARTMRRDSPL